jgi:hypothetical protein
MPEGGASVTTRGFKDSNARQRRHDPVAVESDGERPPGSAHVMGVDNVVDGDMKVW